MVQGFRHSSEPLQYFRMSTKSQSTQDASSDETKVPKNKGTVVLVETYDALDDVDSGMDPVYQAKARILNDAFQQIGMGKYQVCPNKFSF